MGVFASAVAAFTGADTKARGGVQLLHIAMRRASGTIVRSRYGQHF